MTSVVPPRRIQPPDTTFYDALYSTNIDIPLTTVYTNSIITSVLTTKFQIRATLTSSPINNLPVLTHKSLTITSTHTSTTQLPASPSPASSDTTNNVLVVATLGVIFASLLVLLGCILYKYVRKRTKFGQRHYQRHHDSFEYNSSSPENAEIIENIFSEAQTTTLQSPYSFHKHPHTVQPPPSTTSYPDSAHTAYNVRPQSSSRFSFGGSVELRSPESSDHTSDLILPSISVIKQQRSNDPPQAPLPPRPHSITTTTTTTTTAGASSGPVLLSTVSPPAVALVSSGANRRNNKEASRPIVQHDYKPSADGGWVTSMHSGNTQESSILTEGPGTVRGPPPTLLVNQGFVAAPPATILCAFISYHPFLADELLVNAGDVVQ
ncbi:hypothetical protein HK096_006494, partial [Nowakowskiella sp. JEL0078]